MGIFMTVINTVLLGHKGINESIRNMTKVPFIYCTSVTACSYNILSILSRGKWLSYIVLDGKMNLVAGIEVISSLAIKFYLMQNHCMIKS